MARILFLVVALSAALLGPAFATEVGDDGLHKEPWFALTFKDIGEDIEAAKAQGKRLALIVEQRGCIYCKEMHEKVFSDPEVSEFIQQNFMVVQYNMFGDEEVTDLDGDVLSEKNAIRKWRATFTPTILFMPEEADGSLNAAQAAVEIMPGAFGKWTSLNMFRWVKEKGYETDKHFQSYHARIIAQLRAEGRLGAE
jgi:thioredoxin-related protein